jgi:hypothetical protein
VEKRNKHSKKNYAPIWLYLQDYTGIHGQQNIKLGIFTKICRHFAISAETGQK